MHDNGNRQTPSAFWTASGKRSPVNSSQRIGQISLLILCMPSLYNNFPHKTTECKSNSLTSQVNQLDTEWISPHQTHQDSSTPRGSFLRSLLFLQSHPAHTIQCLSALHHRSAQSRDLASR